MNAADLAPWVAIGIGSLTVWGMLRRMKNNDLHALDTNLTEKIGLLRQGVKEDIDLLRGDVNGDLKEIKGEVRNLWKASREAGEKVAGIQATINRCAHCKKA